MQLELAPSLSWTALRLPQCCAWPMLSTSQITHEAHLCDPYWLPGECCIDRGHQAGHLVPLTPAECGRHRGAGAGRLPLLWISGAQRADLQATCCKSWAWQLTTAAVHASQPGIPLRSILACGFCQDMQKSPFSRYDRQARQNAVFAKICRRRFQRVPPVTRQTAP